MAKSKKERKLTEAEKRRLEHFESVSAELQGRGYRRINLVVNLLKANIIALIALVALFVVAIPTFAALHPQAELFLSTGGFLGAMAVFIVLVVVHELVHGLTWSCFTPHGMKDIEFGVMRDSLTPYCVCNEPLRKGPYILGALMPLLVLGVLPLVLAYCLGNVVLLYLGILMTIAAIGDAMIVVRVLRHKAKTPDVLLYDHPVEAGSVIFEREQVR